MFARWVCAAGGPPGSEAGMTSFVRRPARPPAVRDVLGHLFLLGSECRDVLGHLFLLVSDRLQCRDVLGHLFMLGSELLNAVPHDGEIARHGRSCGRHLMPGRLTGRGGARLLGCNVGRLRCRDTVGCQAIMAPTPIRAAMKKLARVRTARLPNDRLSLANKSFLKPEERGDTRIVGSTAWAEKSDPSRAIPMH